MVIHEKILNGIKLTNYTFIEPPVVVGGLALEYHKVRSTGHDYDYIVSNTDWQNLKKLHPEKINLFGGKDEKEIDATINLRDVEVDLIKTLYQHNYNDLSKGSINYKSYKIISLEQILFLKTLDAVTEKTPKSINDQKLIVDHIVKNKYGKKEEET
uniref:Uncharacterized protein n=1 Tax=Megaviridae environmental sample TaxID=1737588 RepID=A0A5J6VM99_9VIRU|nr:MAG: hypothetical protein [Megaviridae environmental sample]